MTEYFSRCSNGTGGHYMLGPIVPHGCVAYLHPKRPLTNAEIHRWCRDNGFDLREILGNLYRAPDHTKIADFDRGKLLVFASAEQALMFKLQWQDDV